jgi:hypothetical protein
MGDQPGDYFAEHSTRQTTISRAALAAPSFGLPLFRWAEHFGGAASSGQWNTLRAAS